MQYSGAKGGRHLCRERNARSTPFRTARTKTSATNRRNGPSGTGRCHHGDILEAVSIACSATTQHAASASAISAERNSQLPEPRGQNSMPQIVATIWPGQCGANTAASATHFRRRAVSGAKGSRPLCCERNKQSTPFRAARTKQSGESRRNGLAVTARANMAGSAILCRQRAVQKRNRRPALVPRTSGSLCSVRSPHPRSLWPERTHKDTEVTPHRNPSGLSTPMDGAIRSRHTAT